MPSQKQLFPTFLLLHLNSPHNSLLLSSTISRHPSPNPSSPPYCSFPPPFPSNHSLLLFTPCLILHLFLRIITYLSPLPFPFTTLIAPPLFPSRCAGYVGKYCEETQDIFYPQFRGSSFIAFPRLLSAYVDFKILVDFRPDAPNGLLVRYFCFQFAMRVALNAFNVVVCPVLSCLFSPHFEIFNSIR